MAAGRKNDGIDSKATMEIDAKTKAEFDRLVEQEFPPGVYRTPIATKLFEYALEQFKNGQLKVYGIQMAPKRSRPARVNDSADGPEEPPSPDGSVA